MDMGIKVKGTTTGAYRYVTQYERSGAGGDNTIVICDIPDFQSNYEIDPRILKKLNFSYEDILAIADTWKPEPYNDWYSDAEISYCLWCYKVGVKNDGCEILVMYTQRTGILDQVLLVIRTSSCRQH